MTRRSVVKRMFILPRANVEGTTYVTHTVREILDESIARKLA